MHGASSAPHSSRKPVKRDRPGRPEGSGDNASERILDAAEEEFAQTGYTGTSLRVIAEKAAVTQALISYYFGSKYELYEAVFIRRGSLISDQRMELLRELQESAEPVTVEKLVHAFLGPALALRAIPAGRRFLRLQARLHTEPAEISYKLRKQAYDASTRAYVERLQEMFPDTPMRDLFWRVALMVGAYMYIFSDSHRLNELSQDICNPDDDQEVISQITAFVTSGIQAPPTSTA
ncbi:TetR/AcrR family transcriptional regulator [Pusillimonas sp. CC-YST705]|uniref:TetR/AcrR family transcriptional regulator n=1 Tax=Mesopusillimonas faecipullorum TaxID=2755040 RepID=A0ABS8CE02_9BURK|nr:TetR/AcrR family transcriptional regulator [Mesopusillimonas faecipullorum]MCB5364257.1 TetR/AcrR family transcriptional regulator [Mesopusillimonas faecipullorum]